AMRSPGFDAIVPPIDASAVVHTRSSSRRPPDPLTAGLFPQRSPPRLLTGAACGGLGSPPALANPEGQTSITGTARFVLATFYIPFTRLSGHTEDRRILAQCLLPAYRRAARILDVNPPALGSAVTAQRYRGERARQAARRR